MSDAPAAPPPPGSGIPSVPPAGPVKPPEPRGTRPPLVRRPAAAAPPPRPPGNLKKYLMIGIIATSGLLIVAIGIRVYQKLHQKPVEHRDVKREWESAWFKAKGANKEIFEQVQAKVWVKGEEIKPEDFAKVKAGLEVYQKTDNSYHELMELMRKEGKQTSQEAIDMGAALIVLKAWIWDANGVLDSEKKAPEYGGLYIPMYRTIKKMDDAIAKLKEIEAQREAILGRNDPAEKDKTAKEIRKQEEAFAACQEEFVRIDDELVKGLGYPDLTVEQLNDLGILRDSLNKAVMSLKQGRTLRSYFKD